MPPARALLQSRSRPLHASRALALPMPFSHMRMRVLLPRAVSRCLPSASKVPYMGAVGNHECGGDNRMHYSQRFAGFNFAAKNSNASSAGSFK